MHLPPWRNRWDLWLLFYWLKNYPTWRSFATILGFIGKRGDVHTALMKRIRKSVLYLAAAMSDIIPENWNNRYNIKNPLRGIIDGNVIGYIDTAPIRIRRPKNAAWNEATYNGGKYKKNVLKMQIIVGHSGLPLFVSGPHIGVRSDCRLWREHGCFHRMMPGDLIIGDKAYAYHAHYGVIAPYKKNDPGGMTQPKRDRNTIIRYVPCCMAM